MRSNKKTPIFLVYIFENLAASRSLRSTPEKSDRCSPCSRSRYRKSAERQTLPRIHRARASAPRVRQMPKALSEVSGVRASELHHVDQIRRVGDDSWRSWASQVVELLFFFCQKWPIKICNVLLNNLSRGIFELAITQPSLDMPEVLWKTFIDFEIDLEEIENARILYRRLLERTSHPKVWLAFAKFEQDQKDPER